MGWIDAHEQGRLPASLAFFVALRRPLPTLGTP